MTDQKRLNLFVALALLVGLSLTSGCYYPTSFRYGKSTDQSINGISVFANALRESGHSVIRKRRLSKRFDRFDTIVWAPDNHDHPPEDVVAWLEKWMSESDERVLIYVGRSYDGKIPYHRGKLENAESEERENWQRELADALIEDREFVFDFSFGLQDDTTPYWFDREVDLKAAAEEELAAVEKAIADKSSAVTAGAVPTSAIPIDEGPTDEELKSIYRQPGTPSRNSRWFETRRRSAALGHKGLIRAWLLWNARTCCCHWQTTTMIQIFPR